MKVGADSVLLGAWMDFCGAGRLLDVGCGCGILALMAAQKLAGASFKIDAIDIDAGAVADAADNFAASPWAAHLAARQISLQKFAAQAAAGGYDAIFCNPPYYDSSPSGGSESRDAARCTDTLKRSDLLDAARYLLGQQGHLSLILPIEQGKSMIYEATVAGWSVRRQCFVKTRSDKPASRLMLELTVSAAAGQQTETLVVGDERYHQLTSEFYL
ncbi:MAG: methyltransferase [Bacteroidales bacterium]|nr:methyltransferase [Bacteroidales bacterium]